MPLLSTFGAASAKSLGFGAAASGPSAWIYEYGDNDEKALYDVNHVSLWVNNTYGGVMGLHQDGVASDTGKSGRPAIAHILNSDGEVQLLRILSHQNFSSNFLQGIGGCALGDDGKFWAHLLYKHDSGTYGFMPVVAHFDSSGDISWARQIGYPDMANGEVHNMTLDEANDIVHTVSFTPGLTGSVDTLTRWNANGTIPWEAAYPASNNYQTKFNDVMYNTYNSNYYLCGHDTEAGTNPFISRFTSSTSAITQGSPASQYEFQYNFGVTFRFHQMAHDSNGNVFVVGTIYGTGSSSQPRIIQLTKFDATLSVQAKKLITPSSTTNDLEPSLHITVDSDDNVIIAGTHDDSTSPDRLGSAGTNNQDVVIMSFSNDLSTRNWHSVFGSEEHSTHLGTGSSGATNGRRLMADDNGSFYLCGGKGHLHGSTLKYRFFIAKLPADGSLIDSLVDGSAVGPSNQQYEWRTATETRAVSDFTPTGTDNGDRLSTQKITYSQDSSINSNFAPVNETATNKTTYNI